MEWKKRENKRETIIYEETIAEDMLQWMKTSNPDSRSPINPKENT